MSDKRRRQRCPGLNEPDSIPGTAISEDRGSTSILTLRKYRNWAIETAQVIEELIEMAKDFQKELEKEKDFGLSTDELAFYDALANNESAVRELGDETLKKIAKELNRETPKEHYSRLVG